MYFTVQDFTDPKNAKNQQNREKLLAEHLVLPSDVLSKVCFLNVNTLTMV